MNNSIIELTKEEALKCLENGYAIYPEEKADAIDKKTKIINQVLILNKVEEVYH